FPLQTGWQIRDPAKQLTSEASSPVRPPARETSCNTADHDIPPGLLARRAKHLIAGFCAISGLVLLTTRAEMSKSTCARKIEFREQSQCATQCPVPGRKNILLPLHSSSAAFVCRPLHQGAYRDRHGRGVGCDGHGRCH